MSCIGCDADLYEAHLTEIYGTVEVCGNTYDSGYLLRELDEIAFRCGMADSEETCGDCVE